MAPPIDKMEIYYEGHNGHEFKVAGEGQGHEDGVILALGQGTDFSGMFESQVETIYNSTAFELGGRYGGMREGMFQFALAFKITSTPDRPWRVNDSRFRKALSYKKDSKLRVKILGESERYLRVRMEKTPKLIPPQGDPNMTRFAWLVVYFIAAYPRWIEDDWTSEFITVTNTSVSGTEIGYVTACNPTDSEQWMKWVCQADTANITWTLPDFSWGDDRFDRAELDDDRMVVLPALVLGEHIVVDTDEMTMAGQVNSSLDTAVYQRMNGREFLYPIPAYTQPTQLPVSVTKAAIGNGVQLRCPRAWTRPWGLD